MTRRYRAFLFNPDDWLSSYTVEQMSGNAVKAYVYLLCRQWTIEPKQSLPNDDAVLARITKTTPEQWALIKDEVLQNFKINGKGIYNERLRKARTYAQNKSKAGASGWPDERRDGVIENLNKNKGDQAGSQAEHQAESQAVC